MLVIEAVVETPIRQREGARRLGLSIRQVKRLVRRLRESGPGGMVSGHRGGRSNNTKGSSLRASSPALVRERYEDLGPTLACEKLAELQDVHLCAETLRQWIVSAGLWEPRRRRRARIHQGRPRRPCPGELVQVDCPSHHWLEDRAGLRTLIVFIDDCQVASNTDPRISSNIDPPRERASSSAAWFRSGCFRLALDLVVRCALCLPATASPWPGRTPPARRALQFRLHNLPLWLPVSTMSQWCVRRSSRALVMRASPNTAVHSLNGRFVVMIIGVCSYRREAKWNRSWPPPRARGR